MSGGGGAISTTERSRFQLADGKYFEMREMARKGIGAMGGWRGITMQIYLIKLVRIYRDFWAGL